jgi:hypothetical protein
VERRGECIDDSIERLRKAVEHGPNSVDVLVPELIGDLTEDLSTDDAVLIGVAWTT